MKRFLLLYHLIFFTGIYLFAQQAPIINQHPGSTNKCVGDYAQLTVIASGDGVLSYEWFKNEILVLGEESNVLVFNSLTIEDNGQYYCRVTNAYGNANSYVANIIVSETVPASITINSTHVSMCTGTSNTLAVTVHGTGNEYTWYQNDAIVGYSPIYNINSASPIDEGNYFCIAQNGCGSTHSDTVFIDYIQNAQITVAPTNQTVCEGDDAVFVAEATGDFLYYQWLKNGLLIPGQFTDTLTVTGLTYPNDSDMYEFVAYNVCNYDTANSVYIFVNNLPQITGHPNSHQECVGTELTLYAYAGGNTTPTYQWYNQDGIIENETSTQITVIVTDQTTEYYCEISNVCGTETTNIAQIIPFLPLFFSEQPSDAIVCSGDNHSLVVKVNGSEPIYYQWLFNDSNVYGANISGANEDILLINSITIGQEGYYSCHVWNVCGAITSDPVYIEVNSKPQIYVQPENQELCEGLELTIDFISTGTEPIEYKWYKIGSDVAVGNDEVLSFEYVLPGNTGNYYCILSNNCGEISTDTITINVLALAQITMHPEGSEVCAGDPIEMEISATGTEPLQYLWYRNGSAISSANNPVLIFEVSTIANSGEYFCRVSNMCNTVDSETVELVVGTSPVITWNPIGWELCQLDSLQLYMNVAGDNFNIQWYHNYSPIQGANDTVLHIHQLSLLDEGYYYSKAYNACDTVYTDTVYVQVSAAPEIQFGEDMHICEGETVILYAPGEYVHYNWNNGLSNQPSIEVMLSGTFILEVMGENYCKNRDTIVVTFHPYHEIVFNTETNISCGPYILNAGEGAYTYNWSTGETNTHFINVTTTGNYSVTVTGDWFGCISQASTFVEIREPVTLSLGQDVSAPVNSHATIGVESVYVEYIWNTGFTGPTLTVFGSEYGLGEHMFWLTVFAQNGCHATDTINVTFTPVSNVEIQNTDNTVKVYPNPAKDFLFIEYDETIPGRIELISSTGNIVLSESISNTKNELNLSKIAPGIYFIRLYNKNGSFAISKIVIQ